MLDPKTQKNSEFNRKILAIAVAIVEDWTYSVGNQVCADTPNGILALMDELPPEHQDRLHAQYELANSGGKDYVEGDFLMGSALIAGGSIEVALKTLAIEIDSFQSSSINLERNCK